LLEDYTRLLLQANEEMNLISRKNSEAVAKLLIEESLAPCNLPGFNLQAPILDIGSGGGIPGIPLAIFDTNKAVHLLEPRRLRVLFLNDTVQELKLSRVKVLAGKAEELCTHPDCRYAYGTVVSRAVTTFADLLKWGSVLLKPGGELILWKGSQSINEKYKLDRSVWSEPEIYPLESGVSVVRFVLRSRRK